MTACGGGDMRATHQRWPPLGPWGRRQATPEVVPITSRGGSQATSLPCNYPPNLDFYFLKNKK
jgi:hypothetical protein